MKKWPHIYYISQGTSPELHLSGIEKVCKAGCKFVQLRLKNTPENIVKNTAIKALSICKRHGAQLIINDHVTIVKSVQKTGLHIGKNDLSISEARKECSTVIIGGTANTIEDCIQLANKGVDYIGLGPLRFTKTKSKLAPIIGLSGYQDIIKKMESLKIKTPIYAIGGITETDISDLLNIGLAGIAASSLLTHKTELEIKSLIKHYE